MTKAQVAEYILISPRWGFPGRYTGYINVAPLGLIINH